MQGEWDDGDEDAVEEGIGEDGCADGEENKGLRGAEFEKIWCIEGR